MKKTILLFTLIGLSFGVKAQGHSFEIVKMTSYFANEASNQVAYIDFGDIQYWGYLEVTITGSFNRQNTVGRYTKRYQIGKNVGQLYTATSETPVSFGLVANQWKLGEAYVNDENHLMIPIYHLVSTQNRLVVHLKGVSKTNFNTSLIQITEPTTVENTETKEGMIFKNNLSVSDIHVNGNSLIENSNGRSIKIDGYNGIETSGSAHWLHLNRYRNDDVAIAYNSNANIYLAKGGGKVGIGTTDTKGFELGVNGKIAALEVKVALYDNWPDYVFEKDYKLPTLKEVEKHIQEKGHLKDIPNAGEVKKDGIFLGEMNAKLLQKIEELTLYTIQQEKEITSLKKLSTDLIKKIDILLEQQK